MGTGTGVHMDIPWSCVKTRFQACAETFSEMTIEVNICTYHNLLIFIHEAPQPAVANAATTYQ